MLNICTAYVYGNKIYLFISNLYRIFAYKYHINIFLTKKLYFF